MEFNAAFLQEYNSKNIKTSTIHKKPSQRRNYWTLGVTVTGRLWGRSSPGERILFINIFISSLWHEGKEPDVEFRNSTRNASKNSAESGEQSV